MDMNSEKVKQLFDVADKFCNYQYKTNQDAAVTEMAKHRWKNRILEYKKSETNDSGRRGANHTMVELLEFCRYILHMGIKRAEWEEVKRINESLKERLKEANQKIAILEELCDTEEPLILDGVDYYKCVINNQIMLVETGDEVGKWNQNTKSVDWKSQEHYEEHIWRKIEAKKSK